MGWDGGKGMVPNHLDPTIRKESSEICILFNPKEDDGYIYDRFVKNPIDKDAYVRKVNFTDNPHFPDVLEKQRLACLEKTPDLYDHIWMGEPLVLSEVRVLSGKWSVAEFEPKPGWDGPYFGADWGFAVDPTTLIKSWVYQDCLYIEHEAYKVGCEITDTPALFDTIEGSRTHVIRADSARPETISHMARAGFKIVGAIKGPGSVEDGVAHIKGYKKIIIHPRCKKTHDEARLWSYKTNRAGDILPVLVDAHNHCFDAVRYALEPLMRKRQYIPTSSMCEVL